MKKSLIVLLREHSQPELIKDGDFSAAFRKRLGTTDQDCVSTEWAVCNHCGRGEVQAPQYRKVSNPHAEGYREFDVCK